jgi:hypothetical protein
MKKDRPCYPLLNNLLCRRKAGFHTVVLKEHECISSGDIRSTFLSFVIVVTVWLI